MSDPLAGVRRRFEARLFLLLGPERHAAWVRHARPVTFDDELFLFHFESAFVRDKFERLFLEAALDAAQRATNRKVRVRFAVDGDSFPLPDGARLRDAAPGAPAPLRFATFAAGTGNRLALAAARAFVRGGPGDPSRLLLVGRSGLGKSHLLGAVAEALGERPGLLPFTADRFRRDFDWSSQAGRTEAFIQKGSSASVLLFDDLQLLSEHPPAQAALARILRALAGRGCRAALAVDRPVRSLEGFTPALRTVLRAGTEVFLSPPDPATGLAFLRARAASLVPVPVLEILAEHVRSSHKDQLHCLARLLESGPPTAATARAVAAEFLNQWSRGLTYADIVRAAARTFGVAVGAIYAEGRSRAATDARHACFYLARKLLGEPFARIGEHFGGRGHATVLQGCRKVSRRRGPGKERIVKLEGDLGRDAAPR
jgi:chromosomal replication initiator protein